jgi:hypothetical protein
MKVKIAFLFTLTFIFTIFSFSQVKHKGSSSQLIDTIKVAFAKRNKNIERIQILDIRTIKDDILYTRGFLVLANGVRADLDFKDNFEDELFALFRFDNSLLNIIKTFEFIPTPRWRDYNMWIENVTKDSVYIGGAGATYGDGPFQKGYKY